MFDPTAYDNMKVVIEGAAYDLDLEGDIRVIDRKDLVDLATLSRRYEVTYCQKQPASVTVNFSLKASLQELAAELLRDGNQSKVGAFVSISFSWNENAKNFFEIIKDDWGPEHIYDERKILSSLHGVREEIIIEFSRMITEEMIDDLVEMFHYSVSTLNKLTP